MQFYDTLPINRWQHLDLTERFYIEKMIALGYSNRSIARGYSNRSIDRGLNRPHSTINNETWIAVASCPLILKKFIFDLCH